ncbi:MAG: methylated-DNA--[protein]-cysteine S-methyltransferase [Robiginitomaculum sp.]|nr:methylated-DNA--[protein]-cysteine S-methyltransferase [Robiginitomaculum sp.]MDQ7078872.1 methylated-DNA--[protein]-cysteine S-methyltransferase [Robiginitomaculum sp.]
MSTHTNDYQHVTRALAFLDEHWKERPDLQTIADHVGLSAAHFHRLFSRWTGTSPKRFMDALAHSSARASLLEGLSVLDASYEAGLSSPGRLHDLFIAYEATTPGEAKARGQGLNFIWGVAPCPFGLAVMLISPRGLSALGFADAGEEIRVFEDLRGRYPAATFSRDDEAAVALCADIFKDGKPVPLALYGTKWQRQVWRALLAIPPGKTTRYGDLARTVCSAKAARAVGAAVGRNPISWIIPCHRVLGADGRLTGYHWGVERKRSMLVYEAINA